MEALNFLVYPFLACLLLIVIHAYFGIHILQRGIIFVDLALAQFIGVGIALSFLLGEEHGTVLALAFAMLGAFILSLSKKVARLVNIEAFIGVLYIFSVSAAILILDRSPHGLEEFKTILNGNIIWVTPHEVFTTFLVYGAVGLLHFILRKRFLALSYEGKGTASWNSCSSQALRLSWSNRLKWPGYSRSFRFWSSPRSSVVYIR
jgi:zinc/manganese transport system permease protein